MSEVPSEEKLDIPSIDGYCVVICGCEGIDGIFGPFELNPAITLTKFLKDNAPETKDEKDWVFESREEALAKRLGLEYLSGYYRDQVCLYGKKDGFSMGCMCNLLPEEYLNDKPWLM